jgi:predicted dehydrogenase
MSDMTRRNFIGASGAAAGMAISASIHGKAHGDSGKIRLGIIGTGARGQQHLREGLWGSKDFEIVAVADCYRNRFIGDRLAYCANQAISLPPILRSEFWTAESLHDKLGMPRYVSHLEMIAQQPMDAVVIATPPHTHSKIMLDCLNAGLHVFCETPMSTSINEARKLVASAARSGRVVQIGHQRRYHPNYNLVARYLPEKLPLGRPLQTESYCHHNSHSRAPIPPSPEFTNAELALISEDVEHFVNWRLYNEPNGGPCIEALPRAIDLTNWICGAPPVRVFTSGGVEYWRDGRETPDSLSVVFEYRVRSHTDQFVAMDSRYPMQRPQQLNRTYLLRGTWSFLMGNHEHGEHERVIGDRGSAILNPDNPCNYRLETSTHMPWDLGNEHTYLVSDALKKKLAEWPEESRKEFWVTHGASYDPPGVFDGPRSTVPINALGSEESAEVHQFRAYADHIRNGGTPRANVMVGLAAVIAGESARRSYETGLPVDIDPALMDFDFETPSISLYDTNAAPIPGTTELM